MSPSHATHPSLRKCVVKGRFVLKTGSFDRQQCPCDFRNPCVLSLPSTMLNGCPSHSSHKSIGSANWVDTCFLRNRGFLAMSTYVLQQQARSPRVPTGGGRIRAGGWDVAVSAIANADRNRILHTLTVPEYMEAWLCLPGGTMPSISASRSENGYRIQRSGPRGTEMDISGSYLTFRRTKLLFTWQRHVGEVRPASMVLIRLYGEFARTRLCLYHVGLGSAEEQAWHLEMWKGSLDRLSALFR